MSRLRIASWHRAQGTLCACCVVVVALATLLPAVALASVNQYSSFDDWVSQTQVTGQFRTGYFTTHWQNIHPFQHTFSIGGWLNLKSAPVNGFSVNLSVATAQSLGLNSSNPAANNQEVPSKNVTTLLQAYAQYHFRDMTVRAGNQLISTPFANDSDFRMIPASFQGVSVVVKDLVPDLTLSGYRMYRFRPWWSASYGRTDTGSTVFNAGQVAPTDSDGFAALGASYSGKHLTASGWYYDFTDRLQLAYADMQYRVKLAAGPVKEIIGGVQALREFNTGDQVLPYRNVGSKLYGGQIGLAVPYNTVFLSYNDVPVQPGKFQGGGFVDPYLQGNFNSSPIYTDIFGMSLGSQFGLPGRGYGIKDVIKIGGLTLIPGYTEYHFVSVVAGPEGGAVHGPGSIHGFDLIAIYRISRDWSFLFSGAYKQSKSAVGRISPNFFQLRYTFGKRK